MRSIVERIERLDDWMEGRRELSESYPKYPRFDVDIIVYRLSTLLKTGVHEDDVEDWVGDIKALRPNELIRLARKMKISTRRRDAGALLAAILKKVERMHKKGQIKFGIPA